MPEGLLASAPRPPSRRFIVTRPGAPPGTAGRQVARPAESAGPAPQAQLAQVRGVRAGESRPAGETGLVPPGGPLPPSPEGDVEYGRGSQDPALCPGEPGRPERPGEKRRAPHCARALLLRVPASPPRGARRDAGPDPSGPARNTFPPGVRLASQASLHPAGGFHGEAVFTQEPRWLHVWLGQQGPLCPAGRGQCRGEGGVLNFTGKQETQS